MKPDDNSAEVTSTFEWWKMGPSWFGRQTTYPHGLGCDPRSFDLADMCEAFSRQHDDELNPPGSVGDFVEFWQSVWCIRGWWDPYWRWPRRVELIGVLSKEDALNGS